MQVLSWVMEMALGYVSHCMMLQSVNFCLVRSTLESFFCRKLGSSQRW